MKNANELIEENDANPTRLRKKIRMEEREVKRNIYCTTEMSVGESKLVGFCEVIIIGPPLIEWSDLFSAGGRDPLAKPFNDLHIYLPEGNQANSTGSIKWRKKKKSQGADLTTCLDNTIEFFALGW